MESVKEYRVQNAPAVAYYLPNFISVEEEQNLQQQIYGAPKPKWKQLAHRRLQNWGGLPHPKGMVAEAIPEWLQHQMDKITALGVFGEKKPNHVLVNEYLPGQGIMPHEDGPLFYPTITTISLGGPCQLNLYRPYTSSQNHSEEQAEDRENAEGNGEQNGNNLEYDLEARYAGSLLLEARSLLVLQEDLYTTFMHGIEETKEDVVTDRILNLESCAAKIGDTIERSTRISLTIRHVPRVIKAKLLLGNKRR
ncbi:alpha-ketoglutarate-dependent dioxygenase alkB homolog 6-like [Penaeus japonicus]|uniref:alpha-ketoglutarate-dependent dioxygenase alkB homolog 6-like n=1 Tax=Penaeus japonicus TaxID=27405 RepID=UPI001C71358B|nr:alpha-ketoglutarate-dependent dioxygenase alkB homolog 6-like [Penaeus japonicus]